MASSPAYEKHPDHKVEVLPSTAHVRAEFAGAVIAESDRALRVNEASYPPVIYIPREDVNMEVLERSEHTTDCPFKGTAAYYSIRVGDQFSQDAIWTYEDPYDQVADLKDCVAFYTDRIDLLTST